jgi:hypothetical protein
MFTKTTLLLALLAIFMVVPALAADCATGNFIGTYTRASPASDPVGNGEQHAFLFQLTLHSDGTVTQYWTGLPDYLMNLGSGSINIGAWKCRDNGNLLVTLISASYIPAPADANLGTVDDIKLLRHVRTTYVFNIDDNNTISKIKSRSRNYAANEDPTDPNGGTLQPMSTTPAVYKRLVASAADITAP